MCVDRGKDKGVDMCEGQKETKVSGNRHTDTDRHELRLLIT